jgi:hypothetical protein
VHAYCDASFGSHHSPHAQGGFVVLLNGMVVAHKSAKQARVAHSTVKAECLALHVCIDFLVLFLVFLKYLSKFNIFCTLFSDANDLVLLLKSAHPRPIEKHLLIDLRAMQNKLHGERDPALLLVPIMALRDLKGSSIDYSGVPIDLLHIDGASNPADALTKPMSVATLQKLVFRSSI